jgi:hypothetical protein
MNADTYAATMSLPHSPGICLTVPWTNGGSFQTNTRSTNSGISVSEEHQRVLQALFDDMIIGPVVQINGPNKLRVYIHDRSNYYSSNRMAKNADTIH